MAPAQQEARCPSCQAAMVPGARYCGSCGGAIAPTRTSEFPSQVGAIGPDMIGREVAGRYRILAKLGEGGMGAVYRAEQMSLKRTVALKVLKPELSAEEGLVRRFNAEATLAAKLNHPNTVTLFDFGQDEDGSLFIAMEYIEGTSLRQVLVKDGPLAPKRVLAITAQICGSLADAHATGIVHRDLKPDNVMLFARGRTTEAVSVLDFGIAKLRDEHGNITQQPMTQAGDILGTPQYMAPEQIRGERVDARTDVYALGVMLYEMTTARLPFEGATVMALLSKHLTDIPVAPSARRPELAIPEPLSQLIMRCLAKSPDERPRTMDEVEQLLGAVQPHRNASRPAAAAPGGESLAHAATGFAPTGLASAPTGLASAPTGLASAPTGLASAPTGLAPGPAHGFGTSSAGQAPSPTGLPNAQAIAVPAQQTPAHLTPPPTARGPHAPHSPHSEGHLPTYVTPKKRRGGLVAVLLLLLIGGAGAGAYVLYNQSADPDASGSAASGSAASGSAASGNAGRSGEEFDMAAWETDTVDDDEEDDDDDPPQVVGTELYTDPAFNYRMELPANFQGNSDRMGTATFSGSVDGHEIQVLTTAWPTVRGLSKADIEVALSGRLAALGIVITRMEWTSQRTLAGVVTVPAEGLRGEFLLTQRGRVVFLAAIGSPEASGQATAEFRRAFLEERYEIY